MTLSISPSLVPFSLWCRLNTLNPIPPSTSYALYFLTLAFSPPPSFPHPSSLLLPLHSLTHCFLLPQIKLYRGRIHGQPTPLLLPHFTPYFPLHHTLLPSFLPPSLSLRTSTFPPPPHTQNEQTKLCGDGGKGG